MGKIFRSWSWPSCGDTKAVSYRKGATVMDKSSTPNNARALWEAFQQTGRVSAYIAYRSALRRERETEDGGARN